MCKKSNWLSRKQMIKNCVTKTLNKNKDVAFLSSEEKFCNVTIEIKPLGIHWELIAQKIHAWYTLRIIALYNTYNTHRCNQRTFTTTLHMQANGTIMQILNQWNSFSKIILLETYFWFLELLYILVDKLTITNRFWYSHF